MQMSPTHNCLETMPEVRALAAEPHSGKEEEEEKEEEGGSEGAGKELQGVMEGWVTVP